MAVFLQVKLQTFVMELITNSGERSRQTRLQHRKKMESGIRYRSAVANLFGLACLLVAASCMLLVQYAIAVLSRDVSYDGKNFIFYGLPGFAGLALAVVVLLEVAVRAMFCQTSSAESVSQRLQPYAFGGGTVGDDPRAGDV